MYAVNIADMMTPLGQSFPIQLLLSPVKIDQIIRAEGDDLMDGTAFIMNCNEERAQAIVEILRVKVKKHELRCYHSKTGNLWRRV